MVMPSLETRASGRCQALCRARMLEVGRLCLHLIRINMTQIVLIALQISSPINSFNVTNGAGPSSQVNRQMQLAPQQEIPQLHGPSQNDAILPNVYTQTQAIILHKVMALEAGQGMILQRLSQLENETRERLNNIEANMQIMQANQASIDGGVKRILEALQRR